jgi:hypothetical protein
VIEIRARAAHYAARMRDVENVRVHRFTLEELYYSEGAARLLVALGVAKAPETIVLPPPECAICFPA